MATLPDELGVQAGLEQPCRQLGPVRTRQRRRVDADGHGQAGLVDGDGGQRDRLVGVGQRLADGDLGQAGHRDDLAGPGALRRDLLERLGDVELGDLGLLHRPVEAAPADQAALGQRAVVHPADGEAPDVGGGREVADQRLGGHLLVEGGGRDVLDDGPEQRLDVHPLDAGLGADPAGPGVGVEDREVDLVLVGVEVQEQLLDLVHDLGDAGVGPVDLVHHEHDRQPGLERLAQHEAGLGQRALRGVHQQQHAVDHGQPTLDLAPEVGVPRSVDDVDLHPAPAHRRVLGQDGDALLPLEVARVHDPVGQLLVGAERAGLAQQGVDQRRLAVVDVGHDGHVPDVLARSHRGSNDRGPRECRLKQRSGPVRLRRPAPAPRPRRPG